MTREIKKECCCHLGEHGHIGSACTTCKHCKSWKDKWYKKEKLENFQPFIDCPKTNKKCKHRFINHYEECDICGELKSMQTQPIDILPFQKKLIKKYAGRPLIATQTIEEKIREICESLFQTGFNKAKNNLTYFPESSAEFRTKQLLALFKAELKQVRHDNEILVNTILEEKNKEVERERKEMRCYLHHRAYERFGKVGDVKTVITL